MGDRRLLRGIAEAFDLGGRSRWSLTIEREPPHARLLELVRGLQGDADTGKNKRIETKFSYLGPASTIGWVNACRDNAYAVMRDGIDSFRRRWSKIAPILDGERYAYVSLGVGTGQKDRIVFDDLARHPEFLYVPVDLSLDMLHIGTAEVSECRGNGDRILPVQLDFSIPENVAELERLVHRLTGGDPVLYGLLGNTIGNFDDDARQLAIFSDLLRPQDRMLLELATTRSLDGGAAQLAAEEYEHSETYRIHATSALSQNTDLEINTDFVELRAAAEGDRALRIEAHYVNRSEADLIMTLPNRARAEFHNGESIRVTLSRKYSRSGIDELLAFAGLVPVVDRGVTTDSSETVFDLELMLMTMARPTVA